MSSINSVSSNASVYQNPSLQISKQAKADFKSLADALNSGDMDAAQTAFTSLNKDAPDLLQTLTGQSGSSSQSNPLSDLATALNNNDLPAAQTAMASLQKGHRGHHHKHAEATAPSATDSTTSSATDTSATEGTVGTLLDVKI